MIGGEQIQSVDYFGEDIAKTHVIFISEIYDQTEIYDGFYFSPIAYFYDNFL